ncbi:uncharacterized protein DNG_01951 [Cephalotrichum gorgonifer]|uniref:Carbohydrate kinase PfkB domain-containing protein n=1 Tax=Cephalotrichum gorgonifer TaxID=2041049 RepID=A0AAE8MSR2_9PEZI|nr:uncharacterized protein DNG_01951 [Cephalotrichum gorgonifer]
MKHIFLVGACYLDTILSVPHYPEEDSKLRAQTLSTRRGGNCPNTTEVLSQLLTPDAELHLISCLPDASSAAAAKIKASFSSPSSTSSGEQRAGEVGVQRGARVDLSMCIHRAGIEEAASSFVIRSVKTGSRTIVNYSGLEEMSADEFRAVADGVRESGGAEESWWHFEGRIPATTLKCIQHLRLALPNTTVSVEVERPGREGLTELASAADVVFYSRSWAEDRGHNDATACLKKETPPTASLALCTWGSRGAAAYVPLERETVVCPVLEPGGRDINVVDTIGAGDTFIAGMLYGLTCHQADWDTRAKLRFAVDLATLKVQRDGFDGLGRDALGRL